MEATWDRKSRKETVGPSFSNALELDLNDSPDLGVRKEETAFWGI